MFKEGLKKRGQLTLFVILGVLVFAGIVALFLILPEPEMFRASVRDPMQEIKPCIAKSLENVLPEYFEKGFYFNPENYLVYSGKNVSYHCYTSSKKSICLRNDAQSKTRIENELKEKIVNEIEQCFTKFKENNKKHDISLGETELSLEVLPGKIIVKTRKEVVISIGEGEPFSYNNFDVLIDSPLFDFLRISNEILNEEVSCDCPYESCTADSVLLMRNNRDYKIRVFIGSRDEKVYTIEDYYGNGEFNFAVKNCDKTP